MAILKSLKRAFAEIAFAKTLCFRAVRSDELDRLLRLFPVELAPSRAR